MKNNKLKILNINSLALLLIIIIVQSCKVKPSESFESSKQTVLVDLKDSVSPEKLEAEFKAYNLQNKKPVSKPLNIFLFTFNEKKITANELVAALLISENVDNAQTNKKVNTRN
jgi:hypothetical protein